MTPALITIIQLILALGLLNVWLIRFNKATPFRGGSAKNMGEEFAAYGLPPKFVYFVGSLKVLCAVALIAGLWFSLLVVPASAIILGLMVGAVFMHLRVRDPLIKSVPALFMLVLSLGLLIFSIQ